MKASKENTAPYFFKAWKLLGLAMLFILVSQISYAQNTKGAEVGGVNKQKRESRFRIPSKKNKQKGKPSSFNRVKGKGPSLANSARKTSSSKPRKVYPQKGPFVNNNSSSSRNTQKAWRGTASGSRLKVRSSTGKTRNVYPQHGRYVNKSSSGRNNQKAWKGTASGSRLKVRSNTGKTRNVFPQNGRYVHNPSRKSKNVEPKVTSNRSTLSRLNRLQRSHAKSASGGGKQVVIPRSASHSFMRHKSINVYANFPRPKPKKEKAHIKDITGRRLRTKNFETPKPELSAPTFKPYRGRKSVGDKVYQGRASGSYQSASRRSERAWKGNISGNKIRGRNFSSKARIEGHPMSPSTNRRARGKDRLYRGAMPTSGYRSGTLPGEARTGKRPVPVRTPGKGANRIGTFQGNLKGARRLTGGGSVSGRSWNNNQTALPTLEPGKGAKRAGRYQGSMPRLGRSTPGFNDQGEGFTGYKKAKKPVKGGGSISGRVWNNRQKPVAVRIPPPSAQRAGTYQGNIKKFEQSPSYLDQGEEFTGFIKLRKLKKNYVKNPNAAEEALKKKYPDKSTYAVGGLQVRVKERDYIQNKNAAEKSILKKKPTQNTYRTGGLQVKVKERDYVQNKNAAKESLLKKKPTQGTYQTGGLQVKVKERDYVQNKNAAKESLLKKKPTRGTYQTGDLQVKVKEREYVQNKNSAKESLLKKKPTKSTYLVDGLQVKVKQREYGKKPHAAEGSMPGIKPSKSSVKASEYARGVRKTWDYIHNPSSADEALKVREPGKAFGRATDYQGNIKMQKFHLFEKNRHLHPDATFVKTNKNNVDGERDILTNVKLWWAKRFKKQDTQPDNLKEKGKKPRYDKREDGLWYD